MIEGAVIEPFQGSKSERISTQGGALRAYPGLCHRTPLGFRRGVIAETLKPDRLHNKSLEPDQNPRFAYVLAAQRWRSAA